MARDPSSHRPLPARRNRAGRRSTIASAIVVVIALAITLSDCATSPADHALAVEWYGVGNAWLDAGKWSEAGKAYDRALDLDPGLVAASYNAARALIEAASYDKALAILDKLTATDSRNVRFIGLRAYALYKAGRMAEATTAYENAWALNQWAPDVVYNSALLALEAGDAEKALERIGPLASAKPDDDAVITLQARAFLKVGKADEAQALLEDLRSRGKADAGTLESLGALYEKSENYAKALDVYAEAVAKDAKLAGSWFALARIRLTQADDAKAGLDALTRALDAGYADKGGALALLSSLHLLERLAVATALEKKGLIEGASTPGGTASPDVKPAADGSAPSL